MAVFWRSSDHTCQQEVRRQSVKLYVHCNLYIRIKMETIAFLALLLFSAVGADITGTDPPRGTCLCFTTTGVNVRDGPCGNIIGTAGSPECYTYTGVKTVCNLTGITYDYFAFDWGIQNAWAAGNYLNTAPDTSCVGSGTITDSCLNCICQIESGCNATMGCVYDGVSVRCGPYQISEPYYIDCGSPGTDWRSCANDMACAETCVRAYMDRYGTYCTGGVTPTCEDYARIHNGGPSGCTCSCTDGYWERVRECCGGQTGCD